MATKPTVLPKWADSDQTDPISLSNNVLTPPPIMQTYGWTYKQFPPRNFLNWLGRYTYRWLDWLKQQEEQAVVTDGNGVGLFVTNNALIMLYATDPINPGRYIMAVGYKGNGGVAPILNVVNSTTLGLGVATASGNYPITGGSSPANLIVCGQSKIIA